MEGISFEVEPEVDSRNYIDFESWDTFEDVDGGTDRMSPLWRLGYHAKALQVVITDCIGDHTARVAVLNEALRLNVGETSLVTSHREPWGYLEDVLVARGYGVYSSDSRFEVYDLTDALREWYQQVENELVTFEDQCRECDGRHGWHYARCSKASSEEREGWR